MLKKYRRGLCIRLLFASFQIATYTYFENDFVMRKNKSDHEFNIKTETHSNLKHVVKQYFMIVSVLRVLNLNFNFNLLKPNSEI